MIWEAREDFTAWMAENPEHEIEACARDFGFGSPPDNWKDHIVGVVEDNDLDHPDGSPEQRLRFLLGIAMAELRGKVPAIDVEAAIRSETGAIHD